VATRPDGAPARGLPQDEVVARVRAIAAQAAGVDAAGLEAGSFRDQAWVRLPREPIREVLRRLRDDADLRFEMLMDLTCVHFPRRAAPLGAFDVVYHLTSLSKGHRIRLKVACPDPDAGIDSAVPVWPGANFLEREAWDMFGVRFIGHPDPRRILMDDEFLGHPMRKEFPYRGH
jgi:NADH-quinone oxidoreductase subunit C